MKRGLIILFVFFTLVVPVQGAFAGLKVSEGYASVNFKELGQTIVGIGILDIRDPDVADDYARLVHCSLYRKNYANDVEWNKIRDQIIFDVMEKREYYRVMYEVYGVFKLGRYDFDRQFFPFARNKVGRDTAMRNVGYIELFSNKGYIPYCGRTNISKIFLPNIGLRPNHNVTVKGFGVPVEKVEGILARMEKAKNVDRLVYGRIRVRITEPLPVISKHFKIEMKGDVVSVDFFLDREMAKPIGGVQFSR